MALTSVPASSGRSWQNRRTATTPCRAILAFPPKIAISFRIVDILNLAGLEGDGIQKSSGSLQEICFYMANHSSADRSGGITAAYLRADGSVIICPNGLVAKAAAGLCLLCGGQPVLGRGMDKPCKDGKHWQAAGGHLLVMVPGNGVDRQKLWDVVLKTKIAYEMMAAIVGK